VKSSDVFQIPRSPAKKKPARPAPRRKGRGEECAARGGEAARRARPRRKALSAYGRASTTVAIATR
jgi:hypothetical protein